MTEFMCESLVTIDRELEQYVVDGGRHPCLHETQPDSAALAWLNEFDEALRHQLSELANTNKRPAV